MRIGDLIRNKLTGDLSVVTGVGGRRTTDETSNGIAEEHLVESEWKLGTKSWITLQPVLTSSKLGEGIVYHAEFFEVISEV